MTNKNREVKTVVPSVTVRMDAIEAGQAELKAMLVQALAAPSTKADKPAKAAKPIEGVHTLSLHKVGSRYWVYRGESMMPFNSVCFDKVEDGTPPKDLRVTVEIVK